MDDPAFWKVIKRARSEADGDTDAIAEGVYEQLTQLSPAEIQSFHAILESKVNAAYSWKLWGAAYLLNGGCSDDGFYYFRGWLIAQGQKAYEAAVADPDTLAKFADPEDDFHECEDLLSAPTRAYESVTGKEFPYPETTAPTPPTPSGEDWDFDDMDATAQHLPRLARIYNQ
jgi:hypothetical protein